ncbi:heparinase II/III domain-containing protein [Paenibacillus eucommiae]|uniref:Heparinase II/III-like C-terminal domain-containing protein n=1 Tax=Paenibacillus eucommiae TaxID=1355755 RepID=A0ABS4IQF6_9BACL|nr:heparinase II/III family protein [Paenibacillus eucommiae]MBP1988844.1 hypothetical protein [Paenibacillus eucommiae]
MNRKMETRNDNRGVQADNVIEPIVKSGAHEDISGARGGKRGSVFFGEQVLQSIRLQCPLGSTDYEQAVREAERFAAWTDEELWSLMYGSTLKRSYHVFSNGYCPSCREPVPMYNWKLDVIRYPWKVECPQCGEHFPKNDFHRFYESGLGEDGVFDSDLADRQLLYNPEADSEKWVPFGVDDGNGYAQDGHRWYFVAYYLLFGHWELQVLEAIRSLSRAYVITGRKAYAHKAFILLDRLADLFPSFDFKQQGIIYEKEHYDDGYLSYWFRSCTHIRDLVIAYDMVFDGVRGDEELVAFIRQKSERVAKTASKRSLDEICRHIETHIFRDAQHHRNKLESNFPMTDTTITLIRVVLGWQSDRPGIERTIAELVDRATAVDGTTGEKGMVVYSAYALFDLAMFLSLFEQLEPGYIAAVAAEHPALKDGYRFFVDMWCLERYYPRIGNTGSFAMPDRQYAVFHYRHEFFTTQLDPDIEYFLWKLYEITRDADFARVIYLSNERHIERCLTKSLLTPEPARFRDQLAALIGERGCRLEQRSVNKERWRLAVLHAGEGRDKRACWMKYDSGGDHGHSDGMSIGLFAKGLDLMPDFGYAPVQYGLFEDGPERPWYYSTAAHNTVVVDGGNHRRHEGLVSDIGTSTLFAGGGKLQVIKARAPEMIAGQRFERTIAAIEISAEHSYFLDMFHVEGGSEHVKYSRSTLSELTIDGADLLPVGDSASSFGNDRTAGGMMKQFATAGVTAPGQWRAIWEVDDSHFRVNEPGERVALNYIDLTEDAELLTALSWVDLWANTGDNKATGQQSAWIPTVMIRRQGAERLKSDFIGIYEPIDESGSRLLATSSRRLGQDGWAIEVKLDQERDDLLLVADRESGYTPMVDGVRRYELEDGRQVTTNAELVLIRRHHGIVQHAAIVNGSSLHADGICLELGSVQRYAEVSGEAASYLTLE